MTLDINAKHEELQPQPKSEYVVIHTEEPEPNDDDVPDATRDVDPDEDEDGGS